VQLVVEVQLTDVPFVFPNLNFVADVPRAKPAPVTVTLVPPAEDPVFGLRPVTVGRNLKRSTFETTLVPPGVVTLTSTVPAASVGETAVIEVAEFTVKLVASAEPNLTEVAPVNPTPVMVTVVPPDTGPWVGDSLVTAGR